MKLLAALALALALPAAAAAPQPAAAAGQDWSTAVSRTPAGAFVLGNPRAKVRLVEYASLTCPHCAAFAAEAFPLLKRDYIRRGVVSLELRHAVRDRADLAASLLARCAGSRVYFGALERIFAAQGEWLPRAAAADEEAAEDTPAARTAALLATADGAGLPALAGLSPAAAAGCIANRAEQATLGAMTSEAWGTRKIEGTPSFLVNGRPVAGSTWAALAPALAAAAR